MISPSEREHIDYLLAKVRRLTAAQPATAEPAPAIAAPRITEPQISEPSTDALSRIDAYVAQRFGGDH